MITEWRTFHSPAFFHRPTAGTMQPVMSSVDSTSVHKCVKFKQKYSLRLSQGSRVSDAPRCSLLICDTCGALAPLQMQHAISGRLFKLTESRPSSSRIVASESVPSRSVLSSADVMRGLKLVVVPRSGGPVLPSVHPFHLTMTYIRVIFSLAFLRPFLSDGLLQWRRNCRCLRESGGA